MWNLIIYELKYYFKNLKELIVIISYFISILVLIPFAGSFDAERIQSLGAIALWITLASAVTIGASSLFARDHESGRLTYYQLLPIRLGSIVAAKWAAFSLFISLPTLIALPLAALLYAIPVDALMGHAVALLSGVIALTLIASLVSILTAGLEKAGAIVGLMALPLSIPVLIFGAAGNVGFLLGLSLLLLPVFLIAGAYSIRASN